MNRIILVLLIVNALIINTASGQEQPNIAEDEVAAFLSDQKNNQGEDSKGIIKRDSYLTIRVNSARVRESPSFDAPVQYGLLEGETALVLKRLGEWFYIMGDDGKKGWGHRSIFDIPSEVRFASPKPESIAEKAVYLSTSTVSSLPVEISAEEKTEKEAQEKDLTSVSEKDKKGADNTKSTMDIKWEGEDRLSVNFLDVDIREALTAIALEKEINITSSQEVTGKITVHLYNLTLDKALDAITMAGGFTYMKKGDLYFVFKPKKEKDPQQERLQMKVFKIRYAELDKVQDILTAVAGTRTIRIHEPTKTVIVEETPENMAKIESIINQWDKKPRQVMIEAKIMEITLTNEMSFGVNWSKLLGDVSVGTGNFSSATRPSSVPVSPIPSSGSGIFANMITAAGTGRQFSAALDALQAKTRINILSTPKILAIHGKPAKVQVGGQQGYSVTTTIDGISTQSIEFIDTGTILDITPFIDDDNSILLDVKPSIRSARIEAGVPVVNATEVSTWLTARDGETLFIGGLIQDTKTKTRESVPCLGGIPGLGTFFGSTTRETGKTELVIMITPNIIEGEPRKEDLETINKAKAIEQMLRKKASSAEEVTDFLISP